MDKPTHFYALGYKGYVELVRATSPPIPRREKMSKQVGWDFVMNRPRHVTLMLVTFNGGTLVKSVKGRRFSTITGHSLKPGTVWKVSEQAAQLLMERG